MTNWSRFKTGQGNFITQSMRMLVCALGDVSCLLVTPGVTFVPFAEALHWLTFSRELLINPSNPFREYGCLDSRSSILYLSADDFCLCVFTEWHFSSMLFIPFVSHADSQISFPSYACWKHPVWQVWDMKFRNYTIRSRSCYEKQCMISNQRCLDATMICC